MRLLQRLSGSDFELTSFDDDHPPPYAILSHTWIEGEEVTYHELVAGEGRNKRGFNKIRFCGEQAAADGLQYFWVDTCCIDKSTSNELNTAINSMFRWYQRASKCYVYLSDVSVPEEVPNAQAFQITWMEAFRQSRWFTRGWTLQELLAPPIVEFFSKEGKHLGSKISLEQEIHQTTKIPVEVLRGQQRLTEFSVDERVSWAATRTTTLKEDKVYCLLGIFEVFLPLIYGEGEAYATVRLREEIHKRHKGQGTEQTGNSNYAAGQETPSRPFCAVPSRCEEALWIVPFQKNAQFVGRALEMAQIDALLANESRCERVAIIGLGGVGKTQIALEFAHQWREKHADCAVFWVPVTNVESMLQAYLEIGQQLQIPDVGQAKSDVQKLVQRKLSQESSGKWLLVFDNADDITIWTEKMSSTTGSSRQIDFLPKSKHGSILFTTRSRKAATKLAGKNVVLVGEMEYATAKGLLEKSLINQDLLEDDQAAADLLLKLTHLPLAIVQAAAYINENDINLSEYAMLLDDTEQNIIDILSEEFEDEGRYQDIKNPIATTWFISFEQIRTHCPLAAEYLSFVSCVAAKDIPQSLLPPAGSAKKAADAIGTLSAYSFVAKHKTGQLLDLHRLVHLATRSWLRTEGSLGEWAAKALKRLIEVFPDSDHANRSVWRIYLPHVKYALESNLEEDVGGEKIDLLWKFGECTYSDGRYKEAEMAFTKVVETRKRVLGEEHPDTLTCINNLALTYRNRGWWKEAEELQVQEMEITKRVLGEEHPDTLTSMGNLALTYTDRGRWKEAEELQVQVMKIRKRVLGEEHPSTLTSMNNLASTYRKRGRWKEAEELQVREMEITKRVLGEEHPSTLTSMNNLALTYIDRGRWEEAEELQVQVMKIRKRVLGEEHPSTLTSMNNLALTYTDRGRWEEAEELQVQVMEITKRVLGEEHPSTLTSMSNLALTYIERGWWKEAEELQVQVMKIRKRVLSEEHPSTLTSMNNLASTYRKRGRWKEAEELQVREMEITKRVLGEEHPSTLTSMNNLAYTLHSLSRNEEAILLMEKCFQLCRHILGHRHPDTQSSLEALNQWRMEHIELGS